MKTAIIHGEYTPKTKAASEQLDEDIKAGRTPIARDRVEAVMHYVRLYKINPQVSRDALAQYNLDPNSMHKVLGPDVKKKLVELGLV